MKAQDLMDKPWKYLPKLLLAIAAAIFFLWFMNNGGDILAAMGFIFSLVYAGCFFVDFTASAWLYWIKKLGQ